MTDRLGKRYIHVGNLHSFLGTVQCRLMMYFIKIFLCILCTVSMGIAPFWALPVMAAGTSTTGHVTATLSPTAFLTIPARLIIPSVHVNASIDTLGITRTGNMAAPDNFSDAGWYKYSAQPGAIGNAIIDGHYESGTNAKKVPIPGVFKNLHTIQMGDDIEVLSANGTAHYFTVVSVTLMSKDASMAPVMASNSTSRLVLITCAGTWLPQQGTFSQRLIVTAVLA